MTQISKYPLQRLWLSAAKNYRVVILFVLLLSGLALRLYYLREPPLDFHRARQFHSIIVAHWLYIQSLPSVPTWEQEVAYANFQSEPFLEPPILEILAWISYSLVGGEYLWLPRLLSLLFWIAGTFPLCILARWVSSEHGALVAGAIYLLLPFAIRASRSFQPEPLMIMVLLAALCAMYQYYVVSSPRWLFGTIVFSAAALFVKPSTVFFLYPTFLALQIHIHGLRRAIVRRELYLFGILSALPIALYSAYGFLGAGFLSGQEEGRFLPELILTSDYWSLWKFQISRVLGFPRLGSLLFIAALFGVFLVRAGVPRTFLLGLWMGYLAHSFFFTYHTATHDYYHLPLIPIVAISVAPIADLVLRTRGWRSLGFVGLTIWGIMSARGGVMSLRVPNAEETIRVAQEVGEHVNHSTRTILLAEAYALPLRYYGQLGGTVWPSTSTLDRADAEEETLLTVAKRLESIQQEQASEYFIVTEFEEFEKQPELRAWLEQTYPTLMRNQDYVIFDLQTSIDSSTP